MIAPKDQARIGVYICHCGTNIAATIDVEELAEFARGLPGVVLAQEYKYMCSDPGQELIRRDIVEQNLNRIVVAACSPLLHEATFRRTAESAGLNAFLVQIANIREQVAWVTEDPQFALQKSKSHLAAAVRRVAKHVPLERRSVTVTPRAMVVGGGIAGIQAALTMAEAGKEVILVEREPSIGGHMAMFDKTFPTLDCAACILTPKMTAVKDHPNIKLLTYSEVEDVSGYVGKFKVKVRRKTRYIDEQKCTGCGGECVQACPVSNVPYFEPAEEAEVVLEPEEKEKVRSIVEKYKSGNGIVVPALQELQEAFNHLPENAVRYVCRELDIPLSLAYRLATFYNAFSLTPQAKHVIRVCTGTACYVKGSKSILEALQRELAIEVGGITDDEQFNLETVNCLGCCGQSPVVTVDEEIFGYMKQTRVPELIRQYA